MTISDQHRLTQSVYIRHLENWPQVFRLENVHFVDGDLLKSRPWEELNLLENFLGVSKYFRRTTFHYEADKGFFCFVR